MKDGRRVVTSTNKGLLIVWDAHNSEYCLSCDVHKDRVQAMAWTNFSKYLISGDKSGQIVYCNSIIEPKNKF